MFIDIDGQSMDSFADSQVWRAALPLTQRDESSGEVVAGGAAQHTAPAPANYLSRDLIAFREHRIALPRLVCSVTAFALSSLLL